jgi:hypothetical protein
VTDEQIKAIVAKYIIDGYEDDNADCLHERDEFYNDPGEDPDEIMKRAYVFYRSANVSVTWPGEGGASEPAGDSPDSPPAGESRLPGPGDYLVTDDANADYARGSWPVLPAGLRVSAVSAGKIELAPF